MDTNIMVEISAWLGAATAIMTGLIFIAQRIPGDQPEKFLQQVVDFIAKFSKK